MRLCGTIPVNAVYYTCDDKVIHDSIPPASFLFFNEARASIIPVMFLRNAKSFGLFVAFWFIAIQSVAPLIHGHIEHGNTEQTSGFHIHGDFDSMATPDAHPAIENSHASGHVVAIEQGLPKKPEPNLFIPIQLFVAACLLVMAGNNPLRPFFHFAFFPRKLLARFVPVPRAPPQSLL